MPTCPVCQGQYTLTELQCVRYAVSDTDKHQDLFGRRCHCPRCQIDIYSWRKVESPEGSAGVIAILKKTFPILIVLLVAVPLGIAGQHPHWLGSLLAIILSLVAFLVLFNKAPAFRISKWAKPFKARPGVSLEIIELGAFAVGLAMGVLTLVLMKYWIQPPAEPEFIEKLVASLTYSLFFILIAVALTGMMANAQVRELDKIMPQPVFTNTAQLLNIVMRSAKGQLGLDQSLTMESIERTGDAGLEVVFSLRRTITSSEKSHEITVISERQTGTTEVTRKRKDGESVTEIDEVGSIARWAVTADMWGRIRSIDVRDWWNFVE